MKKWLIVGGVILVSGASYYYYTSQNTAQATVIQTVSVQTGSLRNVVKATGKVYPIQSSSLAFSRQWTISKIYKKIGDSVKSGDIITEIDAKSAYLDIENAKISLSNAENNYQKIIAWSNQTDTIRANNTLVESQANLELQKKNYDAMILEQKNSIFTAQNTIKSLEEKLSIAEWDLDYTKQTLTTNTTENNLERDISNDFALIDQVYQSLPDTIKTIKDTILIEDKSNPKYGDLWATNLTTKTNAENSYVSVIEKKKNFDALMPTIRESNTSIDTILSWLQTTKNMLESINESISYAIAEQRASNQSVYVTNTSIDSTVASLQTVGSTISTKLSNVNSAIANLKSYWNDAVQNLQNKNTLAQKTATVNSAKNDLTQAKQNLVSTKQNYDTKILQAKQNLESAQNNVKLNDSNYKDILNGATKDELVSASNAVKSAQISLEKANLTLKDYQIVATFDGTIRDIPWTLWVNTASTDTVLIENTGAYEIQVSLDQIDIVKVQAGMSANITLDAFANTIFTGTVSSVSANPTETSNVVSYMAKILLPKTEKPIFAQMSATVEIVIAEKNNVLTIPAKATKSEQWKTFVQVQIGRGNNWKTEKKEVILWITDNGKVEVLSWVTLGEKIVVGTINIGKNATGSGNTNRSATRSIIGWAWGWIGGWGGRPPGM